MTALHGEISSSGARRCNAATIAHLSAVYELATVTPVPYDGAP